MNRIPLQHIPLPASRFPRLPQTLHAIFLVLFLLQYGLVWARLWLPVPLSASARWPEGFLLVLAAATMLASLGRRLPGQSVMLAAIIIAFIGGAVHTVGALTAIPFGPLAFTEQIGQQLFYPLPWAVPLLWIVVILSSRGVARLVLRPWRQARAYGFWLIGLSVFLAVLLALGLEPFATHVKHYWVWSKTRLPVDWYGAPVTNFLGWALTALLILVLCTPSLLNKKPVKSVPDYHALLVWLLLNLLFLTSAVIAQHRPAVVLIATQSLVVGVLALLGTRWQAN